MKSSIFSKFRDFVNIKQPFSSTNYRLSGGFLGGIKYLLFDDFLTALAAGSVNGTNAEPTGGARTVSDVETGISISNQIAEFAGQATAVWGEQSIYYGSVSRAAGLTLITKVKSGTTNQSLIGFDTDTSGTISENAFYLIATTPYVYLSGSLIGEVSAVTLSNSSYNIFTILLRASGAFFYIDGRLVYITSTGSTATLYPGLATLSQTLSVDWVKIPESLYLPTPVLSTGFPISSGTIEDQGSNGYDLAAQRVCLTGTHGRWERYGDTSRIPISSSYTHAVLPHAEMSIALQFRKRSFYTRGTLFRVDKADGSYLTLHTNQYGDWQIFNNRPSGFSNVGMPSKTSITNGDWHGVAVTVSDTDDELASYFDGVQQTTANTIGTGTTQNWNTSFGIGVGGSGVWPGDIRNVVITLNGTVMTQAQAEALSDPDTVITTALLDSYFGAGNYAYYPLSDTGTSDGLGHAETSGLGAGGNGVAITNLVVDGSNAFTRIIPALSSSSDVLGGDGTMEGTYDDESGGGGGTVHVPPNWTAYNVETDGTDEISKKTADKIDGLASVHIAVNADDEGIEYDMTGLLTAGVWYEAYGHFQVSSGTARLSVSSLQAGQRDITSTAGAWDSSVMRWLGHSTNGLLRITSTGAAATFDADYFFVRPADVSSFLAGGSYGTDLYLSVEVTTNSEEGCGLFALCDSLSAPTEMVYALVDSVAGNVSILEMVSSVSTIKATTAITYSAGTALILVTNDTSGEVRCYYGTTLIGSFTRNAGLSGNSVAGIFSCSPIPTFDNLVVYNTTSADSQLTKYE